MGEPSAKRVRSSSSHSTSTRQVNSWSRSQSTVVELQHTWIIENFSLLPQQVGDCIMSPIFTDQTDEKAYKWQLELFPKGKNDKVKGYIGLWVNLHDSTNVADGIEVVAKFKFTLMSNTTKVLAKSDWSTKEFSFDDGKYYGWGNSKLAKQEDISAALNFSRKQENPPIQLDELHCKVELVYMTKQATFSINSHCLELPSVSTGVVGSWTEHFKQLLSNKSLSDVIIQVGGNNFDAHKTVLAARSPVFLAMFESNLTEDLTNTLKIDDIEPDVFMEVLRFIYTDDVENLDELADKLLAAAEKYMLDLLKAKCEASLCINITLENCCQLLILADLHSAERLKTSVLDFVRFCSTQVVQTVEWKTLMRSAKPQLLRDISEALMIRQSICESTDN